ncbi:MAG: extracellular solute-binding protein [Ruminococcaceae bacterium]|nr:extracellular solute-binding protein [Oscillospiraceae bacterium]
MKKITSLLIALTLVILTFAACTNKNVSENDNGNVDEKPTVTLRLWGAQDDKAMLTGLIEDFKKLHTDKNWDIKLSFVGEDDAATEILKDVSAAADVFSFSSDQVATLKKSGALYRVTNPDVKTRNSAASVQAATVDGDLYAYPASAETFFLYYDKAIFSAEEVKSLEKIMAKDTGDKIRNFAMKIDDGWYSSSFFFTAGCTLFGKDGKDKTKCDFNSDKGVLAANYMIDLVNNKKFANLDDAKIKSGFKARTLGAAVSGAWNAEDIKNSLGEDFGVTKLPTVRIDSTDRNLISMANFKLYGVNAQTKFPEEAHLLANFLTDRDAQEVRFRKRNFAPTHMALAGDNDVMASNEVVAALTAQSKHSILQTSIDQVSNFWAPAEAFGTGLIDGTITKSNVKAKLDAFVNSVLATVKK